jgi:galactokinase
MDQVCAFGRGPVAMHIDGDTISFDELRPRRILHLLIVDLCRSKDTRRILADLNACFPSGGSAGATGVREALGPRNLATLAEAEALLTAGDARSLGELMSRAQAHFDEWVAPASPALAAPRLHELLAHPAVAELGWGGKGVGSQGDGCGQVVTRGADERRTLAARLEADLGVRCLSLTLGGGDRPESGRD